MAALGPGLCEKSARYICTLNFEGCGHTEIKKNAEIRAPHGITTKSDRVFAQPGPVADARVAGASVRNLLLTALCLAHKPFADHSAGC